MKTVLITGANGFIGKALHNYLLSLKFDVLGVSLNDGDISQVETWLRFPCTQIVIHLAAKTNVLGSWEDTANFIQTNCCGTVHALNHCRKHGSKFIYISSYMYGNCGSSPISESAKVSTQNPYALTKQFGEDLCRLYRDNFGVDVRILRPFNVYGRGQSIEFLIPMLLYGAFKFGKVSVKDLEPRRDYVYVDDLIEAIVELIEYSGPSPIFNIGTGKSNSVLDVINLIEAAIGRPIEVINEKIRRPNEIMDSIADVSLANRELGWAPRISLFDGIKKLIDHL
jgi:nucleoside-diphosphate-sugar epimerase